jgi:hypothetical protein
MGPQMAKYQSALLFFPIILGSIVAVILPVFNPQSVLYIGMGVIGMGSVIWAKLSLKRRTRQLYEFGFKNMNPKEQRFYILGYVLILLSLIFALFYRFR